MNLDDVNVQNVENAERTQEMCNQMVPDSLEPAFRTKPTFQPSFHSHMSDLTKSRAREVSPVPAPIWPKYVAKGHVYNAIQKLNRIRPSTPIPLINKLNESSSPSSNANATSEDSKFQGEINPSIKEDSPLRHKSRNSPERLNLRTNHVGSTKHQNTSTNIDSSYGRIADVLGNEESTITKKISHDNSFIVKNGTYVKNIQIIKVDTQFTYDHLENKEISHRGRETNTLKTLPSTILQLHTNLSNSISDVTQRNMSPIREQSNEDDNLSIPAQMIVSQNDSIVTDTLLQLTSFSNNEVDVLYDNVNNKSMKEMDNQCIIHEKKNSTGSIDTEEDENKKKEDMDKVIQELTKAVMQSKNVTTLTRAMDQRKALSIDSPYLNQKVLGNRPYLSSKGSIGSISTSSSCTSTEDVNNTPSAARRSRKFKRNSNRLRNSVRTIQSLSRGSKGVDLMKNLWLQTGMITNGRKLLIDSLSEDELSSGSERKNSAESFNRNSNGIALEHRQVMPGEDEVRYSEEPTSFIDKHSALEKELLKRISSGGSTTTATYAEVYSKSQASSTSAGSSIEYNESSKTQKITTSKKFIESDADKNNIQDIDLAPDEIRVESLSSGSSDLGVRNTKSSRKVQFKRDVAENEEIFIIENYDHIPIPRYVNKNEKMSSASMVTSTDKSRTQYGERRWFIPQERQVSDANPKLEAYKELQEKTSTSSSTSVSPIYNDTHDDKSSSSYKSVFSSPYFDYRKTHSRVSNTFNILLQRFQLYL